MTVITCIDDFKHVYRRRVPKMFYDYVESGSYTESTFVNNTLDFNLIKFNQVVATDISDLQLSTQMLGKPVSQPVALAPVGLTGMQRADGEIKVCRVAQKMGVPYTLSTMSVCSVEDVAKHAHEGFWFQLYVFKDMQFVERLIERVREANCSALVITLDLQVLGQRHKDLKNGLSTPPKPTLKNLINLSTKVSWGLGMLGTRRRSFGNIVGHVDGVTDTSSLMTWVGTQFDASLDWDMVKRLQDIWKGPLILKGIMNENDAQKAVEIGADAIVVSNHGGRQLDGALSSIRVLPSIVDTVGKQIEIYLDSGIRTGMDVMRAIGLGADGVMIGRSYIYGLGAYGQEGVEKALDIFSNEAKTTMGLCGVNRIQDFNRANLYWPTDFTTNWSC